MKEWLLITLITLILVTFAISLSLTMYSYDLKYEEKCEEFGLERNPGSFGCLEIKNDRVINTYGI